MLKFLQVVICLTLLTLPALIIGRLVFDPSWHGPPAITRCPGCNHRIWMWQNYERRESNTTQFKSSNVEISAGMSCLYHVDCPTDESSRVLITLE